MSIQRWKRIQNYFEELHHALGIIHYLSALVFGVGATIAIIFSDIFRTIFDLISKPAGPDERALLAVSVVTLIGWLFATIYYIRSAYWRRKANNNDDRLKRLGVNCSSFWKLAAYYSECDRQLFDLFRNQIAINPMPKEAVEKTQVLVSENIDKVLDSASVIFGELTGHQCAICIKIVSIENHRTGSNLLDLKVATFRRDRDSRMTRGRMDNTKTDHVRDNSADEHIFSRSDDLEFRNDVWACDDLKALAARRKYKNSRKMWRDDYNATVVCGIKNLSTDIEVYWNALFCVDSLEKGLDNETAHDYAREFAARLSVLMYRQKILHN